MDHQLPSAREGQLAENAEQRRGRVSCLRVNGTVINKLNALISHAGSVGRSEVKMRQKNRESVPFAIAHVRLLIDLMLAADFSVVSFKSAPHLNFHVSE